MSQRVDLYETYAKSMHSFTHTYKTHTSYKEILTQNSTMCCHSDIRTYSDQLIDAQFKLCTRSYHISEKTGKNKSNLPDLLKL